MVTRNQVILSLSAILLSTSTAIAQPKQTTSSQKSQISIKSLSANSTASLNPEQKMEIEDRVQDEVDRRFNDYKHMFGYITIANGFLLSMAVWLLGERIKMAFLDKITKQVEEEATKQLEEKVKIELAKQTDTLFCKIQKLESDFLNERKNKIIKEIQDSTPPSLRESFEPKQVSNLQKQKFQKLTTLLDFLRCISPLINFTPADYIMWGDGIYFTQKYNEASIDTYDEAIDIYDKAIDACNGDIKVDDNICASAWYGKGNALRRSERFKDAIEAYKKAIEIKPDHFLARTNLAMAIWKFYNDYEKGIEYVDKAIKCNNKYFRAWYNKACYKVKLGEIKKDPRKIKEGIQCLKKAISLNPDKCKELAKDDKDFDSFRDSNNEFKWLKS